MDARVAALADGMRKFGIDVRRESEESPPDHVVLVRGASIQKYVLWERDAVEYLDPRLLSAGLPVLAWGSHVAPRTAEAMRTAGIQYATGSGNAWLEFGDVFVDVRGRPPQRSSRGERRRVTGNIFTTSGSRVIFALLAWPHLWNAPQRDVAEVAGVSLGQVNKSVALLRQHHLSPGTPARDAELLELWAATFTSGLGEKMTRATYHGDVDAMLMAPESVGSISVSGEVAAEELLRPASLILYVERFDPMLAVTHRWRVSSEPNITVREKFWTAPESSGVDRSVDVAPWPLVYADLRGSQDPRVRETAKEWKERRRGPQQSS